jgi:hypothetical protein
MWRVAAMAMVISCHLGLLMLLLRPANYDRDTTSIVENDTLALKLRFILQTSTSTPLALPVFRPAVPTLRAHQKRSGRTPAPLPVQSATPVTALPSEVRSNSTPTMPASPNRYTDDKAPTGDGGFHQRLLDAQHVRDVHGVPGSDRRIVQGIGLINPMNQGVGAVMRATQRLFGVTNRHCIDVDVWRHLTPEELIARRMSSRDVDRIDEQYGCTRPLGLSF